MAIHLNGKEYSEDELAVLEKAGMLHIGEKHDTSSATPSAQALHGLFPGGEGFGVFSAPGVRPGMFNATTRLSSIGRYIPLRRSVYKNEIIEIMTGVTASSGTNNVSACATAPKAGDLKTCQQTYAFGVVHIGMKVDDITQIGLRKDRADVTREFYNQAMVENPWLPNIPGILNDSGSRLRAHSYTLGVSLERAINPVHFVGVAGTMNNTYLGVANQWNGLDRLIRTGYVDAVTGLACPRADSAVTSFAAPITGTDAYGRDIVQAVTDTWFSVYELAENLSMADVNWALVMRPDLFRALVDKWSCDYAVSYCAGNTNSPNNRDAMTIYNARQDMFNGRYLIVDGRAMPVVLDNAIPRETLGNNFYKSDVYGVALSWAGMPLLAAEYFPMDNAEAEEYANAFGIDASATSTVNDGLYRVFKRVTKGCVEYDFFARPRLILDAPFLSFRVDDLEYNSYYKQVDPAPGTSYYLDGGVTYR